MAVKLFVPERDSEKAHLLFSSLARPRPFRLFAPTLLYVECANTLWKYCQFFHYDEDVAEHNLRELRELDLQTVPDEELFLPAFQLAQRHNVSVYDALYLALAEVLECRLVTADRRVVRQLEDSIPFLTLLRKLKLEAAG